MKVDFVGMDDTPMTKRLQDLLEPSTRPLLLPGVANALTARLAEESGFAAVYVSGAGITNTYLAAPDLGLLTFSELLAHVEAITDSVSIPVVVDADTGFGNALNMQRTVRHLERAGAAAIQIEDQESPKKCGHFVGKQVIDVAEMVGKVKAAVDARLDDDVAIIARTDAVAVEGIEAACERAVKYREAGADVLFVEAPRSLSELRYITRNVPGWHVANMVEGGATPPVSRQMLAEMGFSIALYANSAMRGGVVGMRRVLNHLFERGDTIDAEDLIASWDDRQSLVRKPEYDALSHKYGADTE